MWDSIKELGNNAINARIAYKSMETSRNMITGGISAIGKAVKKELGDVESYMVHAETGFRHEHTQPWKNVKDNIRQEIKQLPRKTQEQRKIADKAYEKFQRVEREVAFHDEKPTNGQMGNVEKSVKSLTKLLDGANSSTITPQGGGPSKGTVPSSLENMIQKSAQDSKTRASTNIRPVPTMGRDSGFSLDRMTGTLKQQMQMVRDESQRRANDGRGFIPIVPKMEEPPRINTYHPLLDGPIGGGGAMNNNVMNDNIDHAYDTMHRKGRY